MGPGKRSPDNSPALELREVRARGPEWPVKACESSSDPGECDQVKGLLLIQEKGCRVAPDAGVGGVLNVVAVEEDCPSERAHECLERTVAMRNGAIGPSVVST